MALFSFLVVIFSVPAVQVFVGKKATKTLNKTYGVDINVEKIGLTYSGDVNLKEVLIKDHHNDTLIYVQSLKTSILNIKEITKGQPLLGDVFLESLLMRMKTYKGESSDNLMIFARKFYARDKKRKNNFILSASNVYMENSVYSFTNENFKNPKAVEYTNIEMEAENLLIDGPNVYIDIQEMSFNDFRGIEIINLQTDFSITPKEMSLENLVLESKYSKLDAEIIFTYKPGDLSDFVNKVQLSAYFNNAKISTNDLIPYYKEFGYGQTFNVQNTLLKGTLNNFEVKNAHITGLDRSKVDGDLVIKNAVTNRDKFILQGDFDNLTTNYYDLLNLLPNLLKNALPKRLYKFGNLNAVGNAIVTRKAIDIDMYLYSQLGTIDAFMLIENFNDIKNASYSGNVISHDLNVGELLQQKSMGNAAFDIQVDGSGFYLETLDTKIEGEINKLVFNNYQYKNLRAEGILRDRVFDGKMNSKDPNLEMTFNGVADLSDKIHKYNFFANVAHVDLNKLKLFTRDSIAVFKGDVHMNMKGTSVDDAYGTISFDKTLYTNEDNEFYFEDFEITSSFDEENVRSIKINSPDIIDGDVKGVFRFKNVYDLFRNSIGSLYTNFEPTEITDDEFVEFNFKIYNKIVDIFFPEIKFSPNTIINGKVESNESEFKLRFKSPSIKAFDNYATGIDLQVDNKNTLFNTYVAVDSIKTKYYNVSDFSLINVTHNDTLFMRSEFKGGNLNRDSFNIDFYHTINENNKSVVGLRKSDFIYKDYKWFANKHSDKKNNKIVFDNEFKTIDVRSIVLSYMDEEININGFTKGKDYKNLKAIFKNVDLHKVTPRIDNVNFGGKINGELSVLQEKGNYLPSSEITIKDLDVNNTFLGELKMNVFGNKDLTKYTVDTQLHNKYHKKSFSTKGVVNISKDNPSLNLDLNFDKFEVSEFNALAKGVFSKIRGYVSGDVKLTGSYKKPSIDGVLNLEKAGLKIPYLNVDLDMDENSKVTLKEQQFLFNDVNITDTKYKTKGILKGYIAHHLFSDWDLGLKIEADDKLLVLDTPETEEALYYGTGFISGEAFITGPSDELVIKVNAKTEKGTIFKIPLNDAESMGDNNYIHFLSDQEKEARSKGEEIVIKELKGLELEFELDVNNNAEVEIVVDKSTGSSLKGKGAGTLLIEINTNGKFNMWGDFVAYEGTYNFRYGAFVEKLFTVRDGGTINWDGSPTRAVLDLSAVYKTEANPAILLENSSINRKIPVDVIIDLKGQLIQPNVNFNIEFPNVSSVVKSELDYNLSDESNKELQALSLVSSGQFYNGTFDANLLTGSLVAERASSIFNGIFSNKDDKFQVGLNYVQGVSTTLDEENVDQFGLTLSTQITNRILFNGQVGVPIGGVNESSVVGNVEVEYLVNKDGSLRGKIFNRENTIQYIGTANQGHEQGMGLSYSVDFDNFNELWVKIFKPKKIKDTIDKPVDSIQEAPGFINFN